MSEEASGSTRVTEWAGGVVSAEDASAAAFRSMASTSSMTVAPPLPARSRHEAHSAATSIPESSSVASAASRARLESGCASVDGTWG